MIGMNNNRMVYIYIYITTVTGKLYITIKITKIRYIYLNEFFQSACNKYYSITINLRLFCFFKFQVDSPTQGDTIII